MLLSRDLHRSDVLVHVARDAHLVNIEALDLGPGRDPVADELLEDPEEE
jgi:hypothetical protein